jgi:ribosomal protein S18 acetylase RimI-like enzyme
MTRDEYDGWVENSIQSYAADTARATGEPIEVTLQRSRDQFAEHLPDGLETAGTWLLTVLDEAGAAVGIVWLGPHPDGGSAAYVYEIEIYAGQRGRGLGYAAMKAVEQVARDAGFAEVGLNVHGFNEVARQLYDSLGYRVVATRMAKTLDGEIAGEPS